MEIKITKLTDMNLMRKACESTMDSTESTVDLWNIYKCEHSPIRTQMFWIEMIDIPTFVSVHFVRHKIGVEHFVLSKRDDRYGDGKEDRWRPIKHSMLINAQALIQMARKRLCSKAHKETQMVMGKLIDKMFDVDPHLSMFMIPECEYRGGFCPELKSCGRYKENL